jgi:hypothetical protein
MDVFKRPFLVRCKGIAACCRTGHFIDASMVPRGFGVPPSQHAPSIIAVPLSQHSQHYGERAITQLDYDGSQAPRSENYPRSLRHSLSRSRSQHRPSSRHSSKAPDITIHRMYVPCTFQRIASTFTAPSIANMGESKRSGSPVPLPVPPPHYKGSYRDDRAYHGDPERHRSHRRRDYDRPHDRGYGGKVRVRDFRFSRRDVVWLMFDTLATSSHHRSWAIYPENAPRIPSLGALDHQNIPIFSSQGATDAKGPYV